MGICCAREETRVHRLVRISPFNSAARWHTSFASVIVTPAVPGEDVDISQDNLKIDSFRAGVPGGQRTKPRSESLTPRPGSSGVPERTVSAAEQAHRDADAACPDGAGTDAEDRGTAGGAGGHRVRAPDPVLRAAALPAGEGPSHRGRGGGRRERARRGAVAIHLGLAGGKGGPGEGLAHPAAPPPFNP